MTTDGIDELMCEAQCARHNEQQLRDLFNEVRWLRKQELSSMDATLLETLSQQINRMMEECQKGSAQLPFNDFAYRTHHDFRV